MKRKTHILVLGMMLLSHLIGGSRLWAQSTTEQSHEVDSLKQAVNVSAKAGDYVTTIKLMKQLLALGQTDSSTYFSAGIASAMSGNKAEGLDYLDSSAKKGWSDTTNWGAFTLYAGFTNSSRLSEIYHTVRQNARRQTTSVSPPSEVHQLYVADQLDRRDLIQQPNPPTAQLTKLASNDSARRSAVLHLLHTGGIANGTDLFEAATILQHGVDSNDFKLAHELALKAVELGNPSAKFLVAASEDRYLLSTGRPQLYGTQATYDPKKGVYVLLPISGDASDSDRAKLDVPPLKDALKSYKTSPH